MVYSAWALEFVCEIGDETKENVDSMRTIRASVVAGLLATWAIAALGADAAGPKPAYELRDFLKRRWENECVRFPIAADDTTHVKAGHALADQRGRDVPYQLVPGDPGRIAFMANVAPLGVMSLDFEERPAAADTDLVIEETDDTIRVLNRFTGLALRRKLEDGRGPIAGVRLLSGKWVADTKLVGNVTFADYSVTVTARGPVFAEVRCEARGADGLQWSMVVTLYTGEPVVLLEESFDVAAAAGSLQLSVTPAFEPDHIYYRWGWSAKGGSYGKITALPIEGAGNPLFHVEPWFHWHRAERRFNWVGFFNSQGSDLLMVGALRPGEWVDPQRLATKTQCPDHVMVTRADDGDVVATFPLQHGGKRHWMLAALDKEACLAPLGEEPPDLYHAPIAHAYLVKHGDFPLDMVKDYVLTWENKGGEHPRLFVTPEDVARFREGFTPEPGQLERWRTQKLHEHQMGGAIRYWLGTGDEELGKHIADTVVVNVQNAVDMYLNQDDLVTLGFAPHHQTRVLTALNLSDIAFATGQLTEELRERLRAQFVFIGYTVSRADYWSPERGFAANPNMTSTVNAYKCAIGSLLRSHPLAAEWVASAMQELKDVELDTWSDANGGWLEAPHYAMVSYDYIVGCFLMAHKAGFNDYLFDPKVRKVAEWLAKISTPPDARVNGIRHRPPIGNSYLNEPTSEFGLMAALWRDHDPEFAAQMQWMHVEGGSYPEPGIGGFFPTLAGFRELLSDPSIPRQAPTWGSELFPQTGAILRNGFPGDRETQLHMIAGSHHAHYDYDSGSITLWGKGHVVADDFGYYGCAPTEDHSMVDSPVAAGRHIMNIVDFKTTPRLDYVRGVKHAWERQIAFVKDPDPLAPNYFVIADTLAAPAPATWRLWLTSSNVSARAGSAHVTGLRDVDTDILFIRPAGLPLRTESKTRRSGSGYKPDGRWGPMESTQVGLIASQERMTAITAVVYPRLRNEKPPTCTAIAGGRGVKVETAAGTDYVFLDRTPFTFEEGDIRFEGTAGCVQLRGGARHAVLGAAGTLTAGDASVQEGTVSAPTAEYFPEGGFEDEGFVLFPASMNGISATRRAGDPWPDSGTAIGSGCLALELASSRGYIRAGRSLYVDASRTYRVSMDVGTDSKIVGTFGGYANGSVPGNLKTAEGNVWGYALGMYGPTEGWQRLEMAIGPPGSGAELEWPEGALATWLHIHLQGEPGTVYIDNISFRQE